MTPMIDVVFQLLIFFVVTLKQEDILSKLSAARPAPDPNANPQKQPDPTTIIVCPQGFLFNGIGNTKQFPKHQYQSRFQHQIQIGYHRV
jgi:biopolymer transport protein ExbD